MPDRWIDRREANRGNLTTPTVVFGHQTLTNPTPGWVREQLSNVG